MAGPTPKAGVLSPLNGCGTVAARSLMGTEADQQGLSPAAGLVQVIVMHMLNLLRLQLH